MRNSSALIVVLGLAALLVWIRFSALSVEVFDHDESTFMVVAQSILRGNLPYTEAFDNKPPGLFYAIAAGFSMFGENIVAGRLVGNFALLVAAVCLFVAAKKRSGTAVAAAVAGLYLTAHAVPQASYTSASIVADLPAAAALCLLLRARQWWWGALLAGICLTCATLVRTNLGVVAVAVGGLYLIAGIRPGFLGLARWSFLWLLLGGLLPVVVVIALYAAEGELPLLYASTVQVPLAYISDRANILELLLAQLDALIRLLSQSPGSSLLVILGITSGVFAARKASGMTGDQRQDLTVIVTVLGATMLSMAVGGVFYQHYIVQLFPSAALLVANVVQVGGARFRQVVIGAGALAAAGSVILAVPANLNAIQHRDETPLVLSVAQEIGTVRGTEDVWVLDHALVMFYLDIPPLSPLGAFPVMQFWSWISGPLVEAGAVSGDELARVMAQRPGFVVTKTGSVPKEQDVREFLEKGYVTWLEKGRVTVLRRSDLELPDAAD